MKDIKIHAVLNGYVVKVGCQKVVFTDLDVMLGELRAYLKAPVPEDFEKEWLEHSLNSGKLGGGSTGTTAWD